MYYGILLWGFFLQCVVCSKVGPTPFCQPQSNMILDDVIVLVGMSHVYSERNFFFRGRNPFESPV